MQSPAPSMSPPNQAQARAQSIRSPAVHSAIEWDEHLKAAPRPHLMQAYGYGQAKQADERCHVERFAFEIGSNPVAICQATHRYGGVTQSAAHATSPDTLHSNDAHHGVNGVVF